MLYSFCNSDLRRFFTVPCAVTDNYIKQASGDYVKVLLCILSADGAADSAALADKAGVPEQTVSDAVVYWVENGVLRLSENAPEDASEKPSVPAFAPAQQAKPRESTVKYSPKELAAELEQSKELKYLAAEYEKLKGRPIRDSEVLSLINTTQYYEYSAQSVLLIMEYCSRLGKLSTAYMDALIKEWYSSGIVDYKDVEEKIIGQSKLHSFENKVRRAFALEGKLSKAQQQFVREWQEMGFNIEMIEIAYDRCMNAKNKLSFPYIDGILKNWAGKGIKTPAQADEENDIFAVGRKKSFTGGKRESSYDIDEWEQYAKNFDPNKR